MKNFLIVLLTFVSVSIGSQANHIDRWIYWFDDDYDSAVETVLDEPLEVLVLDTLIDVETAALSIGIHRLNIMFRDTAGYQNILSRHFYYQPDRYGKFDSYEYWFDDNLAEKTVVDIAETNIILLDGTINVSHLAMGLHFITIRFKSLSDMYTVPITRAFFRTKSISSENNIVSYQYWFGDSDTNGITVNVVGEEYFFLDDKLDFDNLPPGLNLFTIRFKDSGGMWSNPISRYIFNSGTANLPADNEIVAYQYWFGNDTDEAIVQNLVGEGIILLDETFDLENLPIGMNSITFRFEDKGGNWSTPLCKYFYNTGLKSMAGGNLIKAYRYWFDSDEGNVTYAEFKNPLVEIDFGNNLQIPELEEEQNHIIVIQFLDEYGNWSVPIKQEFYFDKYGIAAPYLIAPPDNHNESITQALLQWADQSTTEKYQLQVSTKSDFSSTIVDIDDIEELTDDVVEFDLSNLILGYQYFWRVRSIKGEIMSSWSEEWNFITGFASQDIQLSAGWNIISSYINPPTLDIDALMSQIADDIVIVKNNLGQIYYPEFGINDIGQWNLLEGYQVYASNSTILTVDGIKIVPEDHPIDLNSGWSIVSYFRTNSQNIVTAMQSLTDDDALVIAKNNFGQIYYPLFEINDIENMIPGQGYQIYLIKPSTLFYQGN